VDIKILLAVLPAEWVARRCSPKLTANDYNNKTNNLRKTDLLAKNPCPPRDKNTIKSTS